MTTNAQPIDQPKPQPIDQLTHGQVKKGKNWMEYKGIRYDVDTFYAELAWEECLIINGHFMHRTWFFTKSDFPCGSCGSHADVCFNIQSTGVVMKCTYCNLSTLAPPFDITDNGQEQGQIAELVLSEEVTVPQAVEIMNRTGQDQEWIQKYIQRPRPRNRHVHNADEEKELEKGGA
jgi:hypothetical protein